MIGQVRRDIDTVRERKIHLRLAGATRARGHDDDAVGTLGTENGGRRSVFQHRDRGHFVGIEVREAAFHAVDQHQRTRTVPTRHAADEDRRVVVTRLSAGRNGGHAREFTRDGAGDVGRTRIDELLVAHLRDGTQDALLLLYAVSDDHDVLHGVALFGEPDRHRLFVDHGDLCRSVAQERNVQYVAARSPDRELALRVGNRTSGLALDGDGGTRHGKTARIDDAAVGLHGLPLLRGERRRGERPLRSERAQQRQQRCGQAAKPAARCREPFGMSIFHNLHVFNFPNIREPRYSSLFRCVPPKSAGADGWFPQLPEPSDGLCRPPCTELPYNGYANGSHRRRHPR